MHKVQMSEKPLARNEIRGLVTARDARLDFV
jgi:hypothetical protein